MGIIRLRQFFKKNYPNLSKHRPLERYRNRVFAVDASSTIYSFLAKTITFSKNSVNMPTDSHGNMTGHLIGLLYRALLVKQLNIDTVWVFDGKPPIHKLHQLSRRKRVKQEAVLRTQDAIEDGDIGEAVKQTKRSIFVTSQDRDDAQRLVELMGMPVIQAPSEAEAQCAWLVKNKLVEGVIGQDTDTLVFGGELLIKNFNTKQIAEQMELSSILRELQLTYEQFVDFCILCGCDYTAKLPGIGPVKALKMLKKQGTIQKVLQFINNDNLLRVRHRIPDQFNYLIARKLFFKPVVSPVELEDITQRPFQQQELKKFLLLKDFDQQRIENWIGLARKFQERKKSL